MDKLDGYLRIKEAAELLGVSPNTRYVFDVPTSEQKHWLHWMKEQRLLYRLALGQPNQEDLVEILSSKVGIDLDSVRQAVVNLSPWFRRHDHP